MEMVCTLVQAPYESVYYNHVHCLHCVSNCESGVARGHDLDSVKMVECARSRVWTGQSEVVKTVATSSLSHVRCESSCSNRRHILLLHAGAASDSYFHS